MTTVILKLQWAFKSSEGLIKTESRSLLPISRIFYSKVMGPQNAHFYQDPGDSDTAGLETTLWDALPKRNSCWTRTSIWRRYSNSSTQLTLTKEQSTTPVRLHEQSLPPEGSAIGLGHPRLDRDTILIRPDLIGWHISRIIHFSNKVG